MAVTPLPFLDRTAATFKTDTDTFFGSQLPTFSVQVNQVAGAADASATAALASKNAAATSATNAANSATAANTSRTNAANSATSAGTSATNAADSATASAASATAANTSKNASATSAASALSEANRAKAAADSIASGPVTSVNGKTGVVSLVKADIGLSSVDNVSVVASGIGTPGDLISDTPNIDDFTLRNGWYAVGPGSLGVKPIGPLRGMVLVSGRSFTEVESRAAQLYFAEGLDLLPWVFARNSYKGVWTAWVEITLPVLTGNARKPLTPGESGSKAGWSDTLSIPKYIDKMITANATGTYTLNLNNSTVFDLTLTGHAALAFNNVPPLSGELLTVVVTIRQGATARTLTLPPNVTFITSGGLPILTPPANRLQDYIFTTKNGTAWEVRSGAST